MSIHFKKLGSASYLKGATVEGNTLGEVGIDKIVVVARVPKTEVVHYQGYRKAIHSVTAKNEFGVKWDGRVRRNGYKNSTRIIIGGDPKSNPLFQFDPYNKDQGYMRLEFNPNRIGVEGIYKLKTWLDYTSPHGWPAFREWGCVTRIDVNVDTPVPIKEFFWDSRYSVTRERYCANGRLESIYLGKKDGGKNFTRIYDWNACHNQTALLPKTRIERNQKPNCGLEELAQMKNAFDGLRIFHAHIPPFEGILFGQWQLYLDHLFKVGLSNSLYVFEESKRKAVKEYVRSFKSLNLDFEASWEAWPQVVEMFGLSSPGPEGPKLPYLDATPAVDV